MHANICVSSRVLCVCSCTRELKWVRERERERRERAHAHMRICLSSVSLRHKHTHCRDCSHRRRLPAKYFDTQIVGNAFERWGTEVISIRSSVRFCAECLFYRVLQSNVLLNCKSPTRRSLVLMGNVQVSQWVTFSSQSLGKVDGENMRLR